LHAFLFLEDLGRDGAKSLYLITKVFHSMIYKNREIKKAGCSVEQRPLNLIIPTKRQQAVINYLWQGDKNFAQVNP
jgi:hypothetical protein